jgi:hypothetical protein
MALYYCHSCALKRGYTRDLSGVALDATTYQIEKYIKHTAPTSIYRLNSVFDVADAMKYGEYVVNTAASGCIEIDDGQRVNCIWFAGNGTGLTYRNGSFHCPCSSIKVVCSSDDEKVHAYPMDFAPNTRVCADCGCPVLAAT